MSNYTLEHHKQEKVDFVSNLEGTHFANVLLLNHFFGLSTPLRGCILSLVPCSLSKSQLFRFHLEFIILVVAFILYVTVLYDHLMYLLPLFYTCYIILCAMTRHVFSKSKEPKRSFSDSSGTAEFLVFHARSVLNLITAICILAVDFRVFPRELAKAEWNGTGLMDVGVGAYVFCNAMVSPFALSKSVPGRGFNRRALITTIRVSLILATIGLIRPLLLLALDYHVHISEYGQHWNFFVTLALVNFISMLIFSLLTLKSALILAIFLAILHQLSLSAGYSHFIRYENDRSNFILQNLEGFSSLPGYISVAVFGVAFGSFHFHRFSNYETHSQKTMTIATICIVCCALMKLCCAFLEPVCRATVNLAYIYWMIGYNAYLMFAQMICTLFLEYLVRDVPAELFSYFVGKCPHCISGNNKKCVCILPAIYANQLLFFLLANLSTGLFNLCIDTLRVSTFVSLAVIIVHCYTLCIVFVWLKKLDVKLLTSKKMN